MLSFPAIAYCSIEILEVNKTIKEDVAVDTSGLISNLSITGFNISPPPTPMMPEAIPAKNPVKVTIDMFLLVHFKSFESKVYKSSVFFAYWFIIIYEVSRIARTKTIKIAAVTTQYHAEQKFSPKIDLKVLLPLTNEVKATNE